jgi:hypothetical protein
VFFRFVSALLLVVMISMAGVMLEKQTLDLRRAVSRQYYQTDLLIELHVKLRLETQQLTAPSQLAATAAVSDRVATPGKVAGKSGKTGGKRLQPSERYHPAASENTSPDASGTRLPLLRFQHPFNPQGID